MAGANQVRLFHTGIGPRRASRAAEQALAAVAPDAVIVTGVCGSVSASVHEGQLVVYQRCLAEDPRLPLQDCSDELAGRVSHLLTHLDCLRVVGITVARVAAREEKLRLAARGAEVVDMETAEILAVAGRAAIPCVVLRCVSDGLDRSLPDFRNILDAEGELDRTAVARALAGSPVDAAAMAAVFKRAVDRLGQAMEVVLKMAVMKAL